MDRMVSFRLSGEEYRQFRELCLATNARSVSGMARAALRHLLEQGPAKAGNELHDKVEKLEDRVRELSSRVKRLSETQGGV